LNDYKLQNDPTFVQRRTPHGVKATSITVLAGIGVLILAASATLIPVWGGPQLGDHEGIVAECARNMRLTGDWVVPYFLDTPFMRKPPLPYWVAAAASYLFPNDPHLNLPVTTAAARFPMAVSALLTILMMWHLAWSMFGRRVGMVTAVVASSSVFFLLFSANATAEMLLTFCCTWAFLHFWHGVTTRRPWARFTHMMLFYVALGAGMLAKGPAPLIFTAVPLAVWWYTERPLRLLACLGLGGWRQVLVCLGRQIPRQTARAFTHLYLVPGLIVFGLVFIPWMVEVGRRFPHAWNIWNWQYWQRAQGNYEDTRVRGVFYYVPIMIGMVLPWVFLLVEAVASPWLKRYVQQRRALLYVGLWTLVGTAVMSLMSFKKPYYIAPAVPGLLLMLGLVADRFYAFMPTTMPVKLNVWLGRWREMVIEDPLRLAWITWAVVAVSGIIMLVLGHLWMKENYPIVAMALTVIAAGAMVVLIWAGLLYVNGRGFAALTLTAVIVIAAFHSGWYLCGPTLTAEGDERVNRLEKALEQAGIPVSAKLYWVDSRPDIRVSFYHGRQPRYMLTPEEVVEFIGVSRVKSGFKDKLEERALKKAEGMLAGPETVYLVIDYDNYQRARSLIKAPYHDIARVICDPRNPDNDWVIVSNKPSRKPESRPAAQPRR
jgi:4-amino-4-deoxy-L-arabinose transferase-like glycosyltransferase